MHNWLGPRGSLLTILAALLVAPEASDAQIITDGSVGPKVRLSGGNIEIGADLGTRPQNGGNLFHSFEKFSIAPGQTATFTGSDTIKNVISRVTGGEASHLDGKLRSTVGQADLYLLNPAGVVFGPNAQLDVPGSLHVSTAHKLHFADGSHFSAMERTSSGLTVAAPEAFGFLDRPPGRIAVDQSQLQLQAGKTLSLIGGNLDIVGGALGFMATEGGTVNLISVTSAGQVRVANSTVTPPQLGTIQLTDQAFIDTSGNGSGTVRIRGGVLVVDQSTVRAHNTGNHDAAGGIDLQVGIADVNASSLTTNTGDTGRGGALKVEAGQLSLRNGAFLGSGTSAQGDAGQITINADHMLVEGSVIRSLAEFGSSGAAGTVTVVANELELRNSGEIYSLTNAQGNAGTVTVTARELKVRNGSRISSSTAAEGNGGAVIVQASDYLLVSGDGSRDFTGISSGTVGFSIGSAGDVHVKAKALQVQDGGNIQSLTGGFSSGNAGTVNVQANHLLISGVSRDGSASTISSIADEYSTGSAGDVHVKAKALQVFKGGVISTSTFAEGDAGTVNIQADHLLVSADGSEYVTGISSTAEPYSADQLRSGPLPTGDAGTVTVMVTHELKLHDGGKISSTTLTQGDAGQITVQADHVLVEGTDPAGHPSTIDTAAAISSTAPHSGPLPTGNAGTVMVMARELELRDGGQISSESLTQGNAGQITVEADQVLVEGTDLEGVPSVIASLAVGSSGAGGTVTIRAQNIVLQDHGTVATASFGTGPGGPISISAADTLRLDNAVIQAQTASAEGGDVKLVVGRLFDVHNSTVTTSVAGGTGSGGNIVINPPLMVLDGSRIEANAQRGAGGNITIQAGQLIRTPDSVIQASSQESVAGTIIITAPNVDVASSLVILPETFLDASSQLREACAARGSQPTSSLTLGGQGGLPPDPDAPLAATAFEPPPAPSITTAPPTASTPQSEPAAKPVLTAGTPQWILGSPRLACRS